MARWNWKRKAYHFRNTETNESLCWSKGKRGLIFTNDPSSVTCGFCKRILERKHVDESQEAGR